MGAFGLVLARAGWSTLSAGFGGSRWSPPELIHPFPVSLVLSPFNLTRTTWSIAAEPFWLPLSPLASVFEIRGDTATLLHSLLSAIWAISVWSVVGGAIARIAAIELTGPGGENPGLGSASRFAASRMHNFLGGPLGALAVITFFTLLCAVFGLLYRIPGIGPTIAGVLFFLPLVAGLLMTVILIGLVTGWPLMVAAIAVENEDAFDAASRSYGYVQQRPFRYVVDWLVASVLGSAALFVAALLAHLVVHLAGWALTIVVPNPLIVELWSDPANAATTWSLRIHEGWISLIGLLLNGFIYGFFWTSATAIYLLLRLDVDGAPWEHVARDREHSHSTP
jgi:hypothetical protein